ncbi:MAG TPA: inorganic phosphate transporter [Candidatus Angelobacter sp.]|nr:inorganic phosphate transporter [Candidatus Angelobacter sp.]
MLHRELLVEEVGLGVLFVLAFANGANDVGKSVASLMSTSGPEGSRLRRRALLWGGVFSGLGSISAILISGRLLTVFTPQSILRNSTDSSFILAVLVGATIWILMATLFRLPVSTTHTILGAVLLQGIFLFGVSSLKLDYLAIRVILPLAAGPFVALIALSILGRLPRSARAQTSEKSPRFAKISHWGAAAATAYARGINDAPKMAALGAFFFVTGSTYAVWGPYSIVAVAIVAGSLVLGHRVALELVKRVVPLDHTQRLQAGIVTATLVSVGAYLGAPLSTTHVHAESIAGVGGRKEEVVRTLRGMVLPWLVTLPAAGLLAVVVALLVARL